MREHPKIHVEHYPSTIFTTKKTIYNCINNCEYEIVRSAVLCTEKNTEYDFRLWYVCYTLQWISRMYYCPQKDVYRKLTAHRYYELMFEHFGGTEEEINSIYPVHEEVYEKLQTIFHMWSHFLANDSESTFVQEFSYAFEYVMSHDYLPAPEFRWKSSLYPDNYPDYDARNYHMLLKEFDE